MTEDRLSALIDAADFAREMRSEVTRLREIETWARASLPIKAGDAVTIAESFVPPTQERSPGWWAEREHLVSGATGIAAEVSFDASRGRWYAMYVPDVEWSVSDFRGRTVYVSAPGEHHQYAMRLSSLRPRAESDAELVPPTENVA